MVEQLLLEVIACPKCHGDVHPTEGGEALACDRCRLRYPVRDGIPIMLVDEAERQDE